MKSVKQPTEVVSTDARTKSERFDDIFRHLLTLPQEELDRLEDEHCRHEEVVSKQRNEYKPEA